jgi:poly-gamma-glutamate synthesis protein (capsule biosynthesis protein)
VLYGCGDFLTDHEGISGYEEFRGDLALMYFPTVDTATGELIELRITPMQVRRVQAIRASPTDAKWVFETLTCISEEFGGRIDLLPGDGHPKMRLMPPASPMVK